MKPKRYPLLFPGLLVQDIPENPNEPMQLSGAVLMARIQTHVEAYLPHAVHAPDGVGWPAEATHALAVLRGLAGRVDAVALFQAGQLVQRINDAEPKIDGLRKIVGAAVSVANATEESRKARAAEHERVKAIVLGLADLPKKVIPALLLEKHGITKSYSQVCRMLKKAPK